MIDHEKLSQKLIKRYVKDIPKYGTIKKKDIEVWKEWCKIQDIRGSEGWFCPEEDLYNEFLENIGAEDVVLDIGAGNLALDILIAARAKKVYAVEVNPFCIRDALDVLRYDLPRNLIVVCGNGLDFPIPKDVNTLVILMRHFEHDFPDKWLDVPKLLMNVYGSFKMILRDENCPGFEKA